RAPEQWVVAAGELLAIVPLHRDEVASGVGDGVDADVEAAAVGGQAVAGHPRPAEAAVGDRDPDVGRLGQNAGVGPDRHDEPAGQRASTFGRPGSTSCSSTWRPASARYWAA